MTSSDTLAAFQFDSPLRATEFVTAAMRLQAEGHIMVNDAVFVTKNAEGQAVVTETTDLSTGAGALSGAAWGGLIGILLLAPVAGLALGAGLGALRGKSVDLGVSDEFVESMKEAVAPGKTVLVLLVSHIDRSEVLKELTRFPGVDLIASDLSPLAVEVVNRVLEDS